MSACVVEDDDDVRSYSAELVGELGYRVLEAAYGAAALEILQHYPGTRLLFTDVVCPGGMDGRQVAEAAARLRPGLPVLFTTGYARNAIVHGGRLDPGLHLITKPFTRQALAAKLREVLDGAAGAARSLLLVEDEMLVRMVAVEVLREAGFDVEEAATAAEALARMAEGGGSGFAAAILDFGLPDRTADALAVDLRALRADLPLVIASGYDVSEMRHRFTGQPIAFVTKPYEPRLVWALGDSLRTPRRCSLELRRGVALACR